MKAQNLQLLSSRVIQCLGILSEASDFVTVNALAEKLKISKRTLFRELKDIDLFIEGYGVQLISKTGLGIKLVADEDKRYAFKRTLLEVGLQQSDFSREDRQTVLLAELLKNQQLDKFIVYGNQFGVSEATISHDINALEPLLEKYNLSLNRKPGLNLSLEGDEESKRKAIRDFIYNHAEESKFTALLNTQSPFDVESYFENQGPDSILQILNKDVLWEVIHVLKENDFFWVNRLAQNAYIGLILHLTIAIERMFNHESIQMDQDLLEKLMKDPMYERAKNLSEYFEDEFNLDFPDEEVAYISMHLKGARLLHVEDEISDIEDSELTLPLLQQYITRLILEFEKLTHTKLSDDDLLANGLITHLRPALTRVKYKMEIRNPLLNQIQQQYPEVFKYAKQTVLNLNQDQFNQLNDDEVGFIAMHFGAALERLKQNEKRQSLNVAVVCASGIGISSLLASRLKSHFKEAIKVEARSQLDQQALNSHQFDFIVSTMESVQTDVPLIHVNPLLSNEDIDKIQNLINQISVHKIVEEHQESNLSWHTKLSLIAEMTSQIDGLIQHIEVIRVDSDLNHTQLIDTISEKIGPTLEKQKAIAQDLKRREEMGDVVLEDEKIALLHARSSSCDFAKMMVVRAKQDEFTAFKEKGIKTILVLLVPSTAVMELNRWISKLSAAMIEDETYLLALQTQTKDEITHQVIRILEDPYREWMKKQI